MTRQPPGPPPRFEAYRPVEERMGPPNAGQRPPQRPVQRRAPPKKKRGLGVLSWIVIGLLTTIGLAAGAAAVFVLTLPKDFVRDQIIAEVKRQTGRDLAIMGTASFKLYPSIGFQLTDVSLSAPEGMSAKPLVRMVSLDVSVRLLPLLKKEVTIERLVLQKPVFELHTDRSGRKTWDMALAAAPPHPVQVAQAGGTASDAEGGLPKDAQDFLRNSGPPETAPRPSATTAGLEHLELGDVRIEDGTVHYSDARTGARQDATAITMRLGLKSVTQPLEAAGSLVWKSEKIDLDATMTSLKSIIEERPAKLALTMTSRPLTATYSGTVLAKDTVEADGAVTAKAASVKALAAWLGTGLPPVPGFGPLDFKSQVRATGKVVTLSNASLSLDGATGTGQLSIDTAPERPYIKGALKLSELDLNNYIGGEGSAAGAPAPKTATPEAPGNGGAGDAIGDLIGETPAAPGPKVKGFTQRAATGWSEGQIDAAALGLADADVKLSLGRLLIKDIKVGQSQLTVALKNKVMRTTFDDVQLYGGRGKGFVTLDATAPGIAAIGANLGLDGIAAQPLLKDAAGMDWLAGNGRLSLAVSGQGHSQRQIIETLTGKADLVFANGAIVGWNIPGMVRGITQGKLSGLDRSPAEKTDFSEFASTWTITNGLAQNQDLRLVSPLLRVAGSGNVMLPAREVDYTVRPTLVASLQGQGAAAQASGLEIPVRVTGSWDKPKFAPDASGILKDPNRAVEAVKELGKQFKGKDAGEIVKGLLGGDKSGADGTPAKGGGDAAKAKQLLEGLFKR